MAMTAIAPQHLLFCAPPTAAQERHPCPHNPGPSSRSPNQEGSPCPCTWLKSGALQGPGHSSQPVDHGDTAWEGR